MEKVFTEYPVSDIVDINDLMVTNVVNSPVTPQSNVTRPKLPITQRGNLAEVYGVGCSLADISVFGGQSTAAKYVRSSIFKCESNTTQGELSASEDNTMKSRASTKTRSKSRVKSKNGWQVKANRFLPQSDEQDYNKIQTREGTDDRKSKCADVDMTIPKPEFKRTIYSQLCEEPVKLRRVQRKTPKPTASQSAFRENKTSRLRYQYMHNEKILSSMAEEHMKKFKRPPFKNVGIAAFCYEKYPLTEKYIAKSKNSTMTKAKKTVAAKSK